MVGLYIAGSAAPVIWDETEGQYAGAAREMWQSGDWLVPTNDHIPRLNKPPLFYWMILTSYAAFGVNEFAARLPNALSTLAWLFAIYLIGREMGGVALGRRAAYVLATAFGTFVFCHVIMPEPLFAALISLAVWTLLRALREPGRARLWLFVAWVFMGLGSLAKGLHGAAYPLLIAGCGALLVPEVRAPFRKLIQWQGLLAFLLILAPWYAYVEGRYPGFLGDQLFNEQIGHIFNKRWPPDSAQVPLLTFLLQHVALFFPWILFVPGAVRARRERVAEPDGRRRAATTVLWLWPAVTLATVLFSARQDYYTLTSWGALAVLFAAAAERIGSLSTPWRVTPPAILAALGLLLAAGSFVVAAALAGAPSQAAPAAARPHAYDNIRGLSAGEWSQVTGPMFWVGAALLVSGLVAAYLARRRRAEAAMVSVAAGMLGVLGAVLWGMSIVAGYLTLAPVAKEIDEVAAPEAWVVCESEPHRAASLFFYIDRPVHWLGSNANMEFAPRVHGIGAELFLSRAQFIAAWRSSRPVYLITEEARVPRWREELGLSEARGRPIARSGTRVALWNGKGRT